jgi:hypothetical protein
MRTGLAQNVNSYQTETGLVKKIAGLDHISQEQTSLDHKLLIQINSILSYMCVPEQCFNVLSFIIMVRSASLFNNVLFNK